MRQDGASQAIQAESVPLYRSVEQAIADAVARGALGRGDLLTEAVVSDVLQTSRTPVKFAFERLVAQGILKKGDGRGFIVAAGASRQPRQGRRVRREHLAGLLASQPAARSPAAWVSIYEELEREISARSVFGALRVVEVEVANAYGVSRTVAHEVLTRLERLGLIEKDRRGRWLIVPLTPERVEQIYEVRRYLEPPALRAAADHIPQSELARMWERLASAQSRYPQVSETELDALERDIHVECIAYCGNGELIKLLRINQALLITNKHMLGSYLHLPQLDPFLSEHKAILECLGRRDGEAAARALEAHLSASVPKVLHRLRVLTQIGQPPAPPYLVPA